ncbi:MAG: PadR family transcriptional regulator [Actinobacteria bacterium]|nr:MAG: PadR family transcriptional regulator [Actinomycetota bacterium]
MNSGLKGYLDPVILAILSDGALHGYAVIEELKVRSGGELDLPEGTVYPALHRLERRGLLKSGWTSVDGRRRRVYRLTSSGRRELESKAREWRAFARVVDGVLP